MGPERKPYGEPGNGITWRAWAWSLSLSALLWVLIAWLVIGCTQVPQRQGLVQPICLMACQNNASPLDLGDRTENPIPEYRVVRK
jgi:hypothetical protein